MLRRGETIFGLVVTVALQVACADTLSNGCVILGRDPNVGFACQGPSGVANGSFGSASAGKQLTGSSRVIPGYTQLSVASSSDFSVVGTPSLAVSYAVASFFDLVTVNSSALNGSSGRLALSYSLDGTIATLAAGNSVAEVAIDVSSNPMSMSSQTYWTAYSSSTSGSFRVPQDFTFVFGQPFRISVCLGSASGVGILPSRGYEPGNSHVTTSVCAPSAGSATGSGSATGDFVLRDLTMTVNDNLGNAVLDAQLSSLSGTQYALAADAVPEGSSIVMFGSGLIALVGVRWISSGVRS